MLEQYKTLIEQLQHAVSKFNGKTTISQVDIDLMQSVYRELKRYDDKAHLDYINKHVR